MNLKTQVIFKMSIKGLIVIKSALKRLKNVKCEKGKGRVKGFTLFAFGRGGVGES